MEGAPGDDLESLPTITWSISEVENKLTALEKTEHRWFKIHELMHERCRRRARLVNFPLYILYALDSMSKLASASVLISATPFGAIVLTGSMLLADGAKFILEYINRRTNYYELAERHRDAAREIQELSSRTEALRASAKKMSRAQANQSLALAQKWWLKRKCRSLSVDVDLYNGVFPRPPPRASGEEV